MKVLGLIASPNNPSSRARIVQYREPLSTQGINLTIRHFKRQSDADPDPWMYRLGKLMRINPWRFLWMVNNISRTPLQWEQNRYDLIWQNRQILRLQSYHERKLNKPRIFDFDDAIWLHDGEDSVIRALKGATHVVAGNEYLANFARKHHDNVSIIPSVIDTQRLFPLSAPDNSFTIGWMGSESNLRFLEIIKEPVLKFLGKYKHARLMIVSSKPGDIFEYDKNRIIFQPWSPETEQELINQFSIGLMPLSENDFTRGKCSYKMLQYMSCGKPAIVSPVGMNAEILSAADVGKAANTAEEWFRAMEELMEDRPQYDHLSKQARQLVVEKYSLEKWTPVLAKLMKACTL